MAIGANLKKGLKVTQILEQSTEEHLDVSIYYLHSALQRKTNNKTQTVSTTTKPGTTPYLSLSLSFSHTPVRACTHSSMSLGCWAANIQISKIACVRSRAHTHTHTHTHTLTYTRTQIQTITCMWYANYFRLLSSVEAFLSHTSCEKTEKICSHSVVLCYVKTIACEAPPIWHTTKHLDSLW